MITVQIISVQNISDIFNHKNGPHLMHLFQMYKMFRTKIKMRENKLFYGHTFGFNFLCTYIIKNFYHLILMLHTNTSPWKFKSQPRLILQTMHSEENKMKFPSSGQETRYLYSFFELSKNRERSFKMFLNRSRILTIKIPFQEEIKIF